MAGYSDNPLLDKLGFKAGDTIFLVDAPDWFVGKLISASITPVNTSNATWAHGFFTQQAEFEAFLSKNDLSRLQKGFWVSWPKKSSKVETDLTEHVFRDLILPLSWVDTKVAAIDDTWSGLKFLRRKS